jgi:hypothetical protein
MDTAKRKDLMNHYRNRTVIGGVYCILCNENQRRWIRSTTYLKGAQNRFEFAVSIKSVPEPAMRKEFDDYGITSFSFVVLEELKKMETQSAQEFADDIHTLYEIWVEKYENGDLD